MISQPGAEEVVAATRTWLEKAVIGLNLCPFAKPVHLHDRIRYFVSAARSPMRLLEDLMAELRVLDVPTRSNAKPRCWSILMSWRTFSITTIFWRRPTTPLPNSGSRA